MHKIPSESILTLLWHGGRKDDTQSASVFSKMTRQPVVVSTMHMQIFVAFFMRKLAVGIIFDTF